MTQRSTIQTHAMLQDFPETVCFPEPEKKLPQGVGSVCNDVRVTQQLIGSIGWDIPDLVPSDFHLFLHLKRFLSGQRFDDQEKVKNAVIPWLTLQAATFYDAGIQNLVPRYNK
ncbi:hypothetical protein AVEN_147421-1 [Araneus ventricosus]|uniref:Uncharacterized protein n=1 Tax=Araneus ventricosus TaxID=182803 RepID=A0A4Y2DQ39_ARAVE|nr:hypothetical protein AVEN_147421-1 [Araneus ventricosus]